MIRKLILASAAVCMFGAAANAANSITVTQFGNNNLSSTMQNGGLSQSNTLSSTQVAVLGENVAVGTQVTLLGSNGAGLSQVNYLGVTNLINVGQGSLGLLNNFVATQCAGLTC